MMVLASTSTFYLEVGCEDFEWKLRSVRFLPFTALPYTGPSTSSLEQRRLSGVLSLLHKNVVSRTGSQQNGKVPTC